MLLRQVGWLVLLAGLFVGCGDAPSSPTMKDVAKNPATGEAGATSTDAAPQPADSTAKGTPKSGGPTLIAPSVNPDDADAKK